MNSNSNPGRTPKSSRRGALRYGGAALAAGVGSWHITTSARAQSADATPAPPDSGGVPDDFKVVLHAAEVQNWQYVISNLRNLTAEWPKAHLRVVVDGTAVIALQGDNSLTREWASLADAGVDLRVCPNALREHEIDPASIPSFANTSLGGVIALVQAHQEGFVYVKP
jgi:intracellular sulfur oxidation DsrE/DsrF family protein